LVKLFKSLDEIPEEVRNRLNEHLRERLGDTFAEDLKFEEGQWLDLNNLGKQFPSVYEENAKLGSYDLLFSFSDPYKVFVWIITDSRETEPDDPVMLRFKGTYKNIEINANTGALVRIYKETIAL